MNTAKLIFLVLTLLFSDLASAESFNKTINLAQHNKLHEFGDPGTYKVTISSMAPAHFDSYVIRKKKETLSYDSLPKPSDVAGPQKATPPATPAPAAAPIGIADCSVLLSNIDLLRKEKDEKKIPTRIRSIEKIVGCDIENQIADDLIESTSREIEITLKRGTTVSVNVTREKSREWEYSLKSELPGKFNANWGIAILPNQDEGYFSKAGAEGSFSIAEKDGGGLTLIPTVFYTYVADATSDKNIVHGPSLGLGIDQENLSLFAGYNWSFRSNLGLTAGIAVHQQERLLGEFTEGQILAESIETLTEEKYQLNGFVALVYGF